MRFSLFPTVFLTACLVLNVSSKGKQTINFGTGFFPPGSIVNPETGRCTGLLIDIVTRIFTTSDYQLKIVCASPIRIYRMLENGEIDFIVNSKTTAQLDGLVTFVTPPIREMGISLFSHQDNKALKTVSAVRGYQYNGERKRLLEQGYEFYDLPDSTSSQRFFFKERSTYLLAYRAPLIYMFNQNPLTAEHDILEKKLGSLPTFFAISNKSSMFEQIKSTLNEYASKHELEYFLDAETFNSYLQGNTVTIEQQ